MSDSAPVSPTQTASETAPVSPTQTASETAPVSPTQTASDSAPVSPTQTASETAPVSPTRTESETAPASKTQTATNSQSPQASPSVSPSDSDSPGPINSAKRSTTPSASKAAAEARVLVSVDDSRLEALRVEGVEECRAVELMTSEEIQALHNQHIASPSTGWFSSFAPTLTTIGSGLALGAVSYVTQIALQKLVQKCAGENKKLADILSIISASALNLAILSYTGQASQFNLALGALNVAINHWDPAGASKVMGAVGLIVRAITTADLGSLAGIFTFLSEVMISRGANHLGCAGAKSFIGSFWSSKDQEVEAAGVMPAV